MNMDLMTLISMVTLILLQILMGAIFFRSKLHTFQLELKSQLLASIADSRLQQEKVLNHFKESLQTYFNALRQDFEKRQLEGLHILQESISNSLNQYSEHLGKRVDKLTEENNLRLKEISGQVEKRLTEGFEKTTATFTDVVKRLALIDEAQKKITELSSNVVSLQEILADKKSRGAFGEVQLSALIRNMLPEVNYRMQFTLSNNKRADCILFLPEPTGNIVIDAKFPLEAYRKLTNLSLSDLDKRNLEQQFRTDIKKHIYEIAEKYIIHQETADGAIMFIPAEAIFAEIHANYPDLIEEAHKKRVWLTSPTTMMAILTTARAVLKDADTRKQVHLIQEHLACLSKDFDRFKKRMENLARHIQQANDDVKEVKTSANKITHRFDKIEQVQLDEIEDDQLELSVDTEFSRDS